MRSLQIALVQLNPTVGAMKANADKILEALKKPATQQADIVVYSESVLTGYPCEDLIYRPSFLALARAQITRICQETEGDERLIVVGTPWQDDVTHHVYNALVFIHKGEVSATRYKVHLPNNSVFDEKRVFAAAESTTPYLYKGTRIGFPICEDIWHGDVCESLVAQGAELIIVPNGSPYHFGKYQERREIVQKHVQRHQVPFFYLNQVGGQDELVFDGASFAVDGSGELCGQLAPWQEDILCVECQRQEGVWTLAAEPRPKVDEGAEALWSAMVLGLKDYVTKNGFPGVLIGLSGGIDSAISAAIAVDALGADKVKCFMMPSPYTSEESLDDAREAAKLLQVKLDSLSIEPAMKAFEAILAQQFEGTDSGVTEENIQSRSRGLLLMALSNKYGSMVLTTGNKSEMAVGYATLYGDMCGGYNAIKDLYKTQVFNLCHWRNKNKPDFCLGPEGIVVPERIISKPPSAELRPDQKDEDSLPPYEILDAVLYGFIEQQKSCEQLQEEGFQEEIVKKVRKLLDISEYKRRQSPPGVKLSKCAFGKERRYPITNHFRD